MKFSKLIPRLGGTADWKPERHQWELSFACPLCQNRTGIRVSGNPPTHPVWRVKPAPLAMLDSITTDEPNEVQWARIWDSVTIEPSMQQLPHPRQVACAAHFSVINGEVIIH